MSMFNALQQKKCNKGNVRATKGDINHSKIEQSDRTWLPSKHILYLLDTLKLQYQSSAGLITLEQVNRDNIAEICRRMHEDDLFSPKTIANIPSVFSISLCGVGWETQGESRRVKAITNAAQFRFEHIDFPSSELMLFPLHSKNLQTSDPHMSRLEAQKIHNITLQQFFNIIDLLNGIVPKQFTHQVGINADNFSSITTKHEQSVLHHATKVLEQF